MINYFGSWDNSEFFEKLLIFSPFKIASNLGIPIEIHKEHGVYVPELIFGEMMTSSNYNDSEKKVTGGRNGFGAKLCNIFSTKFVVETVNKKKGKKLVQTWTGNMKKKGTVKITDSGSKGVVGKFLTNFLIRRVCNP